MKLKKIITLANASVKIPFLALERSLRSCGCDLPIWVIPYDDNLFELPKNSHWWKNDEIIEWTEKHKSRPHMRKYQCLLEDAYQFIDTDAIFLKNPESFLEKLDGFITSCCHWHNPQQTQTDQSKFEFQKRTTIWQSRVFNSGQFASEYALYTFPTLKNVAETFADTCLKNPFHEQPGLNILVLQSNTEITNITLPPYNIESSWAGDYNNDFKNYWSPIEKKPYILHWAGEKPALNKPIDQLFFNFLTNCEKKEFLSSQKKSKTQTSLDKFLRKSRAAWKTLKETP